MPYLLNGTQQAFDEPFVEGGTTFVPVGKVAEAVGAIVDWDNLGKVATIELDDTKVRVSPDTTAVEVNGAMKELQAAPFLSDDGQLWAPVRLFEQVLPFSLSVQGENVTIDRR